MSALAEQARILVVARPARGRAVAEALAEAGHEVYRTPDAANALAIVRRLRPNVVIIALDLPWFQGLGAVEVLRGLDPPVPVVLLGDAPRSPGARGQTVLPVAVDRSHLREVVADLLCCGRQPRTIQTVDH